MLRWPARALDAIKTLFRPLQDIDVCVEDAGDETFYEELLTRLVPSNIRIRRVFGLGGRDRVLAEAATHDFGVRAALYIIDGDFDWVRGDPPPQQRGIYRFDAYCIENLILCPVTCARLIMQETSFSEKEASVQFDCKNWRASIRSPLVGLFCAFATVNRFEPDHPTVSTGVGRLLTVADSKPRLDAGKVEAARQDALGAAAAAVTSEDANTTYKTIHDRAMQLDEPLKIVSGKDFLLPLLDFKLREVGCRIKRSSLRLRLAATCNLEEFQSLADALVRAARP